MDDRGASLLRSEPIFPVADVVATVRYYRGVLGFEEEWLWGSPSDFGGVRWGKVGVMFSQRPGQCAEVGGQSHAFFVDGIASLYELHRRNGAIIESPLEAKPWGLSEYTVSDLDGHHLRFGQASSDRSISALRESADCVDIIERLPTLEEYLELTRAVGWSNLVRPERAGRNLAGARCGVVAVGGTLAVGAGLVIGDGSAFAYLKDIMVHPDWQGRGVGSRIVESLMAIVRRTGDEGMLVALFTRRNLMEFYERFGFQGPDMGLYGLSQRLVSGPS